MRRVSDALRFADRLPAVPRHGDAVARAYGALAPGVAPVKTPAMASALGSAASALPPPGADLEVSVRVHADGGSVSVVRRRVGDRTVGIDALIR